MRARVSLCTIRVDVLLLGLSMVWWRMKDRQSIHAGRVDYANHAIPDSLLDVFEGQTNNPPERRRNRDKRCWYLISCFMVSGPSDRHSEATTHD